MLWLLAIFVVIYTYGALIEPRLLLVRSHFVKTGQLSQEVGLIFASDFHASVSVAKRVSRKIARLRETHKIEIVMLGGDFLHQGRGAEKLGAMFDSLTKLGLPVLAVLGNHDYSKDRLSRCSPNETLLGVFSQLGITVLENESFILRDKRTNSPIIECVGAADLETDCVFANKSVHKSDDSYRQRAEKLTWLNGRCANADCPTVTICHNPDGVYLPGQSSVLCLSGHTHGGQVFWAQWIPRWVSRALRYWAEPTGSRRFWSGTMVVDKTSLLVSRGVGTVHFRLGRIPEIHVVIIT